MGDETKMKKSKDIKEEIQNLSGISEYPYNIGKKTYTFLYPIPSKTISIITKNGKIYKSTVYCIDDIKHIISYLKMENPIFKDRYNNNIRFVSDINYELFLFLDNSNEIKDISNLEIKYESLEKKYKSNFAKFQEKKKKSTFNLIDINENINIYTKLDNVDKELYYLSGGRRVLKCELNLFFEKKERKIIENLIYGIFGNYASGKSIFLMYYNYDIEFPSVYLNLKVLKKARGTEGFINLLTSELMNFFFKLKKTYEDYKNFLSQVIADGNEEFEKIILLIIENLKENKGIIILDQYQESIFKSDSFILKLKKYLYDESSKIKIIIASSMNDNQIRKAYINYLIYEKISDKDSKDNDENKDNKDNKNNKDNKDNKLNHYIPYHFIERLIDNELIEKLMINEKNTFNEKFKETIKKFNYLPLYFSLCKQNIKDLDRFISDTKIKIIDKIEDFLRNDYNLGKIDEIRKMIDNEIEENELSVYSNWIPFKYFYIEKIINKKILRCYFPLVKEIWIENIMRKTADLFDGEINYDGNVIGSLLELNLVMKLKQKKSHILDINSIVQVNCINDMTQIIEKDTNNFENKNILITQKYQNGKNFDLGYIKGKEIDKPKFAYIQVKKGHSNNKINLDNAKKRFNETKSKFQQLFNLEIEDCNLVYISIVNDKINKTLNTHNNYKNDKNKKVSDLGKEINSIVYSINSLENFCLENSLLLYYFNPNNDTIFIKDNNNNFTLADLDLFKNKDKEEFNFRYNVSHLYRDFNINKEQCKNINNQYLNLKRNINQKDERLKNNLDGLDANIIFDFAEKYFKNPSIYSYVNFERLSIDSEFNDLPKTKAIICLQKSELGSYNIDSVIFKNSLYKKDQEMLNLKIKNVQKIQYDWEYNFIVIISFEGLNENGKKIFKSK